LSPRRGDNLEVRYGRGYRARKSTSAHFRQRFHAREAQGDKPIVCRRAGGCEKVAVQKDGAGFLEGNAMLA
jgi:hypothetical protein